MRVEEERMKESGMDKLIELLNEYNKEIGKPKRMSEREVRTHYSWVICSGYGFIKWLVQNGKIDFDKCGICYEINSTYDHYNLEDRQDLWLTMLLSISSSPIEDLIFYLKK